MKSNSTKKEISISLVCRNPEVEGEWKSELRTFLKTFTGIQKPDVHGAREMLSDLILIDAQMKDWQSWVRDLDRSDKSVILVLDETDTIPRPGDLELVSDLITFPFRAASFLSMIRNHFQRKESRALAVESAEVLSELNAVNGVLEKILASKTPRRFNGIKGIQVLSKHLSGLKPGGDYFDLFESEKKDFVNFLLVDSSSYGISAALLGMILSSSAKIASSTHTPSSHWVRAIFDEIRLTLGETGHFSVFFGRLNRRDFSLHYQMYGSVEAYVVDSSGATRKLEKHGIAISNHSQPYSDEERVIHLQPRDRLVLLSDGFVGGAGGEHRLTRMFSDLSTQDPFALINELTFQIKSKLNEGETFPGEDCTAIVIDVESRVLRLAPTG